MYGMKHLTIVGALDLLAPTQEPEEDLPEPEEDDPGAD
jgi:hypothetical protein